MHPKRRPALAAEQLAFSFEAPSFAPTEAALAGLDRWIAAGVGHALKDDPRSRAEVAGAMGALIGDEVSVYMLDAYASEAREQHNISAGRWLALIAATDRYDILDAATRRIGCGVLVGEEMHTARLGHLDRQIAQLQAEKKRLQTVARPIRREARA